MTRTDNSEVPDYLGRLRLDGRAMVVIGAGQGIGRQACHALASAGARVACVDREADLAQDVATEVGGVAFVGDAVQRREAERLFAEAGLSLGPIHGVVDIVGMAHYANLVEVTDEEWDWHLDIVLRHAYLAMQLGGRAMAAGGGGRWSSSHRCQASQGLPATALTGQPRPA